MTATAYLAFWSLAVLSMALLIGILIHEVFMLRLAVETLGEFLEDRPVPARIVPAKES
jgi:hypothetical protein